jgi:hypothetical protein
VTQHTPSDLATGFTQRNYVEKVFCDRFLPLWEILVYHASFMIKRVHHALAAETVDRQAMDDLTYLILSPGPLKCLYENHGNKNHARCVWQ